MEARKRILKGFVQLLVMCAWFIFGAWFFITRCERQIKADTKPEPTGVILVDYEDEKE